MDIGKIRKFVDAFDVNPERLNRNQLQRISNAGENSELERTGRREGERTVRREEEAVRVDSGLRRTEETSRERTERVERIAQDPKGYLRGVDKEQVAASIFNELGSI